MFLNWIAIIIGKENINWIQKWRYGFKQFYVHIKKKISTLTAVIWNLVTYCILKFSSSTPSFGISTLTFYRIFCRRAPGLEYIVVQSLQDLASSTTYNFTTLARCVEWMRVLSFSILLRGYGV